MNAMEPSLAAASRPTGLMASSVGRKVLMAVTGLVLYGFVTVHMIGNLQAYLGAGPMNHYAELLHGMLHGGGIWLFRGVMVLAAGLHVWMATTLTLDNWSARPEGYRAQQLQAATWGSRTMRWSGAILGIFILFHLLHLTTGQVHPDFLKGDAYHNFVVGFRVPLVSAFYVLAQVCLGLHLWHGIWSLTQTLGWSHPRYDRLRRRVALGFAVLIAGVNISFPLAVLAGIIR